MNHRKYLRNKLIITTAVTNSLLCSLLIWLDVSLERVAVIFIAYCLLPIALFYINVKGYVLRQSVKQLYNSNIESQDFEMAKILIHYGKYREALMKLRFVALEQPDNKDLKSIIKLVEKQING